MNISSVKMWAAGVTLLAGALLGVQQCRSNQREADRAIQAEFEQEENGRYYVTEGISFDDISESKSIKAQFPHYDSKDAKAQLRINSALYFDLNNNKRFEQDEAKVFNATKIITNPLNKEELIFQTQMADSTFSEVKVKKENLESFKYKIEANRVYNWSDNERIKNNPAYPKVAKIKQPKIVTVSSNNMMSVETFGKGNDKNIRNYFTYYSDGILYRTDVFNKKDSTNVITEYQYYLQNGDSEDNPNWIKNAIICKEVRHINKDKTRIEHYQNDTILDAEDYINDDKTCIEHYQNGALASKTINKNIDGKDIITDKFYYPNGQIKKISAEGECIEYYENGNKYHEKVSYIDGEVSEIESWYYQDGTLKQQVKLYRNVQYGNIKQRTDIYRPDGSIKQSDVVIEIKDGNRYVTKEYDENGKEISYKKEDEYIGG